MAPAIAAVNAWWDENHGPADVVPEREGAAT
jgi:hypothetical protein